MKYYTTTLMPVTRPIFMNSLSKISHDGVNCWPFEFNELQVAAQYTILEGKIAITQGYFPILLY